MTALAAGMEHRLRVQRRLLGYAGLLPFFACLAVLMLTHHEAWRAQATAGMLHYAALIAAFLGAVHWGVSRQEDHGRQRARLAWGVTPALLSWLLLQLPADMALAAFALLFVLMLLVDRHLLPLLDADYRSLRLRLTAFVTGTLILAALFVRGAG